MNWGYRILVVMTVFVMGVGFMVYTAVHEDIQMLDNNYYVREKEYQSLIDAEVNLEEIRKEPLIQLNEKNLLVKLPPNSYNQIREATLECIKPDNQALDISFKMNPDTLGVFAVSKNKLTRGVYKIRVKWSNGNKMYYSDENYFVQ